MDRGKRILVRIFLPGYTEGQKGKAEQRETFMNARESMHLRNCLERLRRATRPRARNCLWPSANACKPWLM